jgi:hypothetical protein
LADDRGKPMASEPARWGTRQSRAARHLVVVPVNAQSARHLAWLGLYGRRYPELWPQLLLATDR